MKEVAAVAGVSLSTVSRVVNDGPTVRPDLAEKVHAAVALLGYRHNATASALRRADGLSASIGLIFEDVSNPFFSAVHRGIEEVARRRGVLTFAGSSDDDPARERGLAESFAARGVDGIVVSPSGPDQSYLLRDRRHGVAMVFVDRPGGFIDADAVLSDNVGGAIDAVSHLAAAGHRRIAYLGDRPEIFTATERLRGYREALARQGLDEDPALVRAPAVNAYAATRDLLALPDPPTALFTAQNLVTVAAVRALHDLGAEHDVAIVGFDDVMLADVVRPGLTVVAQHPVQIGRAAAELLFARLDGDDGPSRTVAVPVELIARGSGELPAAVRA
jgi:LacI family transcriptional regulator